MGKYIYDNETGKRYEIHDDKDKNDDGGFAFALLALLLLVAFAPGMIITSLFAFALQNSLWAWFWSILFSALVFFVIWYFYTKVLLYAKYWRWTIITYIIISAFCIWILKASNVEQIQQIVKLLLGNN